MPEVGGRFRMLKKSDLAAKKSFFNFFDGEPGEKNRVILGQAKTNSSPESSFC